MTVRINKPAINLREELTALRNRGVSDGVVTLGEWTIAEIDGALYFSTDGGYKMKLAADGDLEIAGTLTQSATII
jgi:hypothetical protein